MKNSIRRIAGSYLLFALFAIGLTIPATAAKLTAPSVVSSDAILWFDAADFTTITTNTSGQITRWNSRVGSYAASSVPSGMSYPIYDMTTYGMPIVDFGAVGSNRDFTFNKLTNIRTVFWVIKIAKDVNAFWLGDNSGKNATYNFHRGDGGMYANQTYSNFSRFWNGLNQVSNIYTEYPDPDEFAVITAEMSKNSTACSLARDRQQSGRNGGRQLSELICFSRTLTDDERESVVTYLQTKWFQNRWDEIDVSVSCTDANTEFSLDGVNWSSSLDNAVSTYSNTTIYARNTSSPGSTFVWHGLTGKYSFADAKHTAVTLTSTPGAHHELTCECLLAENVNVWNGTSGDFYDDSSWSLGRAPISTDSIVLPNSDTAGVTNVVTVSGSPFSVRYILIGGDGAGYVLLKCANGLSTNEVSTSVVVRERGIISHEKNPSSATTLANAVYKLNMKIGGNLIVEKNGEISANWVGYAYGKWPGGGQGTYGGYGSPGTGHCYGSIREPTALGAGGQNNSTWGKSGGGAIYLDVTGDATVDGFIRADAPHSGSTSQHYWDSGASGGSVFIKCATLRGSGTIRTQPSSQGNTQGGGGRIAIYQRTATNWSAFTGLIRASATKTGSATKGGPGTIYLECAADTPTLGDLVVDGDSGGYPKSAAIDTSSYIEDAHLPFGRVIVGKLGNLKVLDGATLKVKKGIYVTSGATFSTGTTSGKVELVPQAGETCVVTGALSAAQFVCNVPGAMIQVGSGSKINIYDCGYLHLVGSDGSPLSLLPVEADKTWQLSVGADLSAESLVEHVAVSNSNASLSMVTAYSSSNLGGNVNWAFIEPAQPGDEIVWTGNASTVWADGSNWDRFRVPIDTDVIVIPAGCDRYPSIGAAINVNSVSIASGASLTLNAADLIVTNNFTCAGSVVANNDSKLIFTGDGEQTVDLANGEYSRIFVEKSGGAISFAHGFTVSEMRFDATVPVTVTFAAGETVTAAKLNVFGLVTDGLGGHVNKFTFASSTAGSPWLLDAGVFSIVRGVNVSDCNASSGALVKAGALCANGGGNTNWDFSSDGAAFWTGAAETTDFLTAGNWYPQAVPSSSTFVQITPAATAQSVMIPAGESEIEIGSLAMAGDSATGILTVRSKLAITGPIEIGTNSTVNLDYKTETNTVGGFCKILRGGTLSHTALPTTANTIADGVYAINLAVAGDMTVYAGGSVNATMKGYNRGKGPGTGIGGASHGSEGSAGMACYGSIFEPMTHGSGGRSSGDYGKPGGGVIKLDVAGDLTVSGSILADSGAAGNEYHDGGGSGGSVFIKCATLRGAGTISARGNLQGNAAGGAGRIAIYQRTATDWTEFTGTIPLNSAVNNNLVSHPIYLQCANDAEHGGTLYVRRNSSTATTYRKVWLMPSYDGGASAYRNMAIVLEGGVLGLSDTSVPSGKRMPIRDLDAKTSTSYIYCNGRIVTVLSRAHKNCKGWASTYETHVIEGGGKVRWATHLTISIR